MGNERYFRLQGIASYLALRGLPSDAKFLRDLAEEVKRPDLKDKDGDVWVWATHYGETAYFLPAAMALGVCAAPYTRQELEREYGPVTEV